MIHFGRYCNFAGVLKRARTGSHGDGFVGGRVDFIVDAVDFEGVGGGGEGGECGEERAEDACGK